MPYGSTDWNLLSDPLIRCEEHLYGNNNVVSTSAKHVSVLRCELVSQGTAVAADEDSMLDSKLGNSMCGLEI